jgi:drug/metabolite transporter (DMT)-like permease
MNNIGEIAALITALLWSISSFIFTEASVKLGPVQINFYRMVLACIMIFITVILAGINYSVSQNQFIFLSISGLIGLVIGDTFLFKAFSTIGARLSMLIMSANPGIAAIIAYFALDEKLSNWAVLGIAITIFGIAMVVLDRGKSNKDEMKLNWQGIIYAFLGAIGQAVGIIFAKYAKFDGDINPFIASFIRLGTASLLIFPIALYLKKLSNPRPIFSNRRIIYLLIAGSIIGPYLGITLSYVAIINTHVGIASTLMSTPPVIMLPIVYFIYHEKLNWKSILGAIIAVTGIAILFLK